MIKVRSTLPEFVHNIIISDSDYFDIEPGGIGNRIFKYYLDKKIISINFERETTKILQFNLDKYNDGPRDVSNSGNIFEIIDKGTNKTY